MIIETPDGPVEFPDTMPQQEIEAALQKLFPPDVAAGRQDLSQLTQGAGAQAAPEQDQAAYDAQIQTNMRNQRAGEAYEALPGYAKPLQAASDLLTVGARLPASMLTGAASLVSPGEYKSITPEMVIARLRTGQTEGPEFEAELAKQKQQYEDAAYRSGWAGTAAQVAATAGLPIAKIFGAGKPLLNIAATGGAGGMTAAAGNEENPLLGAAGGVAGVLGGTALGKGISFAGDKLLGAAGKVFPTAALKVPAKAPPLDANDFKSLASTAYDEAESHGVIFNRQGLIHLRDRIVKELTDKGYAPENQPGLTATLRTLDDYINTGNATQRGMQTLREMTSGGYQFQNKKNNMLVSKVIDEIDDLSLKMNPQHMSAASNNPKAAAEAARYARLMYSKGAKLQTVNDLVERGTLQGDTNISKNVRQSVRKQLSRIVDPTRPLGRGFTAAEKEGVRTAIATTRKQDIAHGLSGLMPRDKLSASISLLPVAASLMTGNPLHAALAIPVTLGRMGIGAAAEKWANRMAQKSVGDLVHLLSTGQTTSQAAQSVLQKLTASKRAAVMAGLARAGAALAASTQPLNEPEVSSRMSDVTGRIGGML